MWKSIEGFDDYQVNEKGEVKSLKGNKVRILKPRMTHCGYMQVCLNKCHWLYVHRLVAAAFIPNPRGYDVVNHINGTRNDNRVENLEWCTQSQNVKANFVQVRRLLSRRVKYIPKKQRLECGEKPLW